MSVYPLLQYFSSTDSDVRDICWVCPCHSERFERGNDSNISLVAKVIKLGALGCVQLD